MRAKFTAAVLAAGLAWSAGGTARAQKTGDAGQAVTTQKLENAAAYFDRARKLAFPSAGQKAPYVLTATFTTRASSGVVESGTYTDTWLSDTKWRREATLGNSRFARSRDGKRLYRITEGPDAALLQYVLTAMEPLPATDSLFHEQDWNVRRDSVDGVPVVRVATGHESADGTPDPKDFYGFWFDDSGQLVKSYGYGLETRRSDFADFNGVKAARRLEVLMVGKVGMRIDVTSLDAPAGKVDMGMFKMKGHNWEREYTFELR